MTDAPAVIAVWKGPEHIFEFANDSYHKTFGYRDLIGKSVREALPEIAGQGFYEMLDNVYKTGEPFIGKEVYSTIDKNNDGNLEVIYWNFIYQPIYDENNQIVGIFDFSFDVTELVLARKKLEELNKDLSISEAKYKNLAESLELKVQERTVELSVANEEIEYQRNKLDNLLMNAPLAICLLEGPEHIYRLYNPFYSRFIGHRNLIGKTLKEALPEVEGQGYIEILDNVYKTGEPFIGNELTVMLDDTDTGVLTEFYVDLVYQPIIGLDKQVEGIGAFVFDVTEKVKDRKVLNKINQDLKSSNESLQSFAYIASHDLQEPLRIISSYAQLLERRYKDRLDDNANEFIDIIQDASKRMKILINDILDYSRISKKEVLQEPIYTNKVIENVKSNLKLSIDESKANITYSNLPSVPVEKIHLIQLFQNILGNAIKYRKKDRPLKIDISAKKENDKWLFSISDNGIGINKEDSEKVFEIFKRLHGRYEYEGTGIGLANCKKIVELYDGNIWVEGLEDEGSTFYFTLPALSV